MGPKGKQVEEEKPDEEVSYHFYQSKPIYIRKLQKLPNQDSVNLST